MTAPAPAAVGHTAASLTAFTAIVRRDVPVTSREAVTFAVQTLVQPLFFLFVFGKLLTGIGVANRGFSVLLPGVVAFSAFITPLQTVASDLSRGPRRARGGPRVPARGTGTRCRLPRAH